MDVNHDNGMIARLEYWAAARLAGLTDGEGLLFKTAAPWRYQVDLAGSGAESFDRYAPFAFVKVNAIEPTREGDYDLNLRLELTVCIGQTARADGDARLGNATLPGCSALADRVRAAFEGVHPNDDIDEGEDAFGCDNFYFAGLFDRVEEPKRHAMQLQFECNYLAI